MKKWIWMMVLLMVVLPQKVRAESAGIPVGGINILMTEITAEPLVGAEFQILRELQEGELTNPAVEKRLCKINDENKIMVVAYFWPDRQMTGEQIHTVTTDSLGKGAAYGLHYGTYYLVQTKTPAGYNRIADPIRVTIHKYSHLTADDNVRDDKDQVMDNTLHIINVRYTLPDTGSWGTLQLAAAGTGVLFSSAALLLLNLRRRY